VALSDTCSDTLTELGRELVWYSDWDYEPEQLIPDNRCLYRLATFTAGRTHHTHLTHQLLLVEQLSAQS
jgi:hypothetical protein